MSRWISSCCALLTLLVFCATPATLLADDSEKPRPPGAVYEVDMADDEVPNFLERTVEFMWLEHGRMWKDRFRARVYPRHPVVGTRSRINLLIRRFRDGSRYGKPDPMKTEIVIRRAGTPKPVTHEIQKPGTSISYDYSFTQPGEYSVRLVTYYSEIETYTVTLKFRVALTAPEEKN